MTSSSVNDGGYHKVNNDKIFKDTVNQLEHREKTQLSLIDINQQKNNVSNNNDQKHLHSHTSSHSSELLWMLVDGIGLAIVAGNNSLIVSIIISMTQIYNITSLNNMLNILFIYNNPRSYSNGRDTSMV